MGIGPNKVYSYISVAIIGFLPLVSFLIFGAQWSHLALFCQNLVFLLSDGRIPDSLAFLVMTSRTFSFLGGGVGSLCTLLSSFSISSTCRPSCAFFDIAHFDILNEIFKVPSVRRLPDVTSATPVIHKQNRNSGFFLPLLRLLRRRGICCSIGIP